MHYYQILYLMLFPMCFGLNGSSRSEDYYGHHRNVTRRRQKRIIHGEYTEQQDFPYVVQIIPKINEGGNLCGGSILTQRYILTAAHCFLRHVGNNDVPILDKWMHPAAYKIVAGTNEFDGIDGTTYDVETYWIRNILYETTISSDDLAIAKTSSIIAWNDDVAPIGLPLRQIKTNARATIAGFGTTEAGYFSNRLKKLSVIMYDAKACSEVHDAPTADRKDSFCGHTNYNKGFGICQGDSGNGLVRYNVVIGVASTVFGKCATKPDEYTDVWYHLQWIKTIIRDE